MSKSELEESLALQIRVAGLPEPEREYMFAKGIGRRWRFDFCWIELMTACEVEGGVYSKGRHTRGKGFTEDCEKYNSAALMGWRVLRFPASMVLSGEALDVLERALCYGLHSRVGD
jgi:very-short-patch-repair endonuclease